MDGIVATHLFQLRLGPRNNALSTTLLEAQCEARPIKLSL